MDSNPGLLSSALIEFGRCGNYCCHSMTDAKQHAGFAPLETLPAEWYNNYNYLLDTHINQVQTILRQAQTEIANVLEAGGQTPDATSTCQLLPAINCLIADARPAIATGSTTGLVASSNASNAVSVNGTTGVMTPNALCDWSASTTVKSCIDSVVSGTVSNATLFAGCSCTEWKSIIEGSTVAQANSTLTFGGYTYEQAKADIRSGLSGNTGTVTSVAVYCDSALVQTITESGSICLSKNAFNAYADISTAVYPGACCTGTSNYVVTTKVCCSATADTAGTSSTSNSLGYTGTGVSVVTANQTSGSYCGSPDGAWASYLIFNHGDGSNYYHQMLRMPFGGVPQYQQLQAGVLNGWHNFITDENIAAASVANATCFAGLTYAQAYADIRTNVTPYFANGTLYPVGDDVCIGDANYAGMLGIKSANNNAPGFAFIDSQSNLLGCLCVASEACSSILGYNGTIAAAQGFCIAYERAISPFDNAIYGGYFDAPIQDLSLFRSLLGTGYEESTGCWWSRISIRHKNGYNDGNLYGLSIFQPLLQFTHICYQQQINGTWSSVYELIDSSGGQTINGSLGVGNMTLYADSRAPIHLENSYNVIHLGNDREVALGYNAGALAYGVALGNIAGANNRGIAVGTLACATSDSIALGVSSKALTDETVAIGAHSCATGCRIMHMRSGTWRRAVFSFAKGTQQCVIWNWLAACGADYSPMWPAYNCSYCGQHIVVGVWQMRNAGCSELGLTLSWDGDSNIDFTEPKLGSDHNIYRDCTATIPERIMVDVSWETAYS